MSHIFNISPRYPFLDVLATYIIKTVNDPLKISEDLVLLPTRRACRRLKEIFDWFENYLK